MNKKDKERIALKLIEIAKDVKGFLSFNENPAYTASRIVGWYDEEREELLVNLLKDQTYATKFSEEYLEKLLKEKMRTVIEALLQQEPPYVRPQAIARSTAEEFFNELDTYMTSITLYLPVSGIDLQLEEEKLEIGNIIFQRITQGKAEELQNQIALDISKTKHTLEEKEALVKHFSDELQRLVQEKQQPVYAIYQAVAEPIQAMKRAREECYKVFDLLRYTLPYISSYYPMEFTIPQKYIDNTKAGANKFAQREKKAQIETGKSIIFGLEDEIGVLSENISDIILMRGQSFQSWKSARQKQPKLLRIDNDILESLRMAKIFEASAILQKADHSQTNFERCILRSIHWFANAQTSMQPEYVVLSLMSSIEAFLNPPNHEKVTPAITEGVAVLGGKAGYTYAKKRVEDLYEIRSALSHGDRADIMERDILELRAIAFYIIHQMLQSTDEFTTQEQFYEEVKKLRDEMKQDLTKTEH